LATQKVIDHAVGVVDPGDAGFDQRRLVLGAIQQPTLERRVVVQLAHAPRRT
jgi:hypothetical protein